MTRRSHLTIAILAAASIYGADARAATQTSDVAGIWMTDDGDGAVEIRACGAELCGHIYAILRLPHPERPALDNNNANVALRGRTLCGMPMMGGLRPAGPGQWSGGWIYDPKAGKTYGLDITLQGGQLSVHGTLPGTLLGRTVTWSRTAAPPRKCVPPRPQR